MSIAIGLIIGVPLGFGLSTAAWAFTFAAVEHRHRQHILELQQLIESKAFPQTTPVEVQGLGKLTSMIVSDGYCAACGSDHPGLAIDPFSQEYHRATNYFVCPVPYSRQLYQNWSKKQWHSSPLPNPPSQLQKLLHGGSQPSRLQPPSE